MPTLKEIKQQIENYPYRYIFWTQKEIRALPKILDRDEIIRAVTSGMMNGATWLLVCTNKRLVFLNCGMVYGLRQVQLPLDRIQSIDHEFTLVFGSISVWDGASSFCVKLVLKSSILPFVKATQEAMYAARNMQQKSVAGTMPNITDQLTKLAELKEKGYLTDQEFQAQKKKLLGS